MKSYELNNNREMFQDLEKRWARRRATPLIIHSPTFLDLNVDILSGGHRSGSRRRREGGGSRGSGLIGIERGGDVGNSGTGFILFVVIVR